MFGFELLLLMFTIPLLTSAGDSGLKEYELRTAGRKGKQGASADDPMALVRAHTGVYFPSRETVLQSKGGRDVSVASYPGH